MSAIEQLVARRPQTLEAHVAAEIKAQMARLGVSQMELGNALKISNGQISKLLGGKQPLKLAFIEEVCAALDLPIRTLFDAYRDGLPRLDSNQKPAVLRRERHLTLVAPVIPAPRRSPLATSH